MQHADIIVIGAGAAGLLAARDLSSAGKNVILLEGNNRIGGRIHSISNVDYPEPLELGAEFIHGDLPLTKSLLKEAGIQYDIIEQDFYRFNNDRLKDEDDEPFERWPQVMDKLAALKEDTSLSKFLNAHFSGKKNFKLRKWAKNYAAGYDAADANDASAKALFNEWRNEEDQYRIYGGYMELIDYLSKACSDNKCQIVLSEAVKQINWKNGHTEVLTEAGNRYSASKVVITVPLGILQSKSGDKNYITFKPTVPEILKIINSIGFGPVMKIVICFNTIFWDVPESQNSMRFILSDEEIPTWWTNPDGLPVLTGWVGGPMARKFKGKGEKSIMNSAIKSLSTIFKTTEISIQESIQDFNYSNWADEPFAAGAYSYIKAGYPAAKEQMAVPFYDTLYFAGEAYGIAKVSGTVEAALMSGQETAKMVLASLNQISNYNAENENA